MPVVSARSGFRSPLMVLLLDPVFFTLLFVAALLAGEDFRC